MMENLKKGVSDRSEELIQSFQRLQGKMFHAMRTINGTNYMYSYRIGFDGKLTLEQKMRGLYVTGEKIEETRRKLLDAGKAVPINAQRKWRKAVTGDPNKRIRDHMKETPQVKMLDKFSFTLGVLTIVFSQWLLLRQPQYFAKFSALMLTCLIVWRYFDYKSQKYELFLLDFCYFVNLSVIVQSLFFPDNRRWFDLNYVMCMGPVCVAVVVWQNSSGLSQFGQSHLLLHPHFPQHRGPRNAMEHHRDESELEKRTEITSHVTARRLFHRVFVLADCLHLRHR